MPRHIDHIALMVSDLERSAQLFAEVFNDAQVVVGEGDHDARIRLGGVTLVMVTGQPPAAPNGDHIAFAVDPEEFHACAHHLREQGIEVRFGRGDTALYFTDYDNHVFELVVADA